MFADVTNSSPASVVNIKTKDISVSHALNVSEIYNPSNIDNALSTTRNYGMFFAETYAALNLDNDKESCRGLL